MSSKHIIEKLRQSKGKANVYFSAENLAVLEAAAQNISAENLSGLVLVLAKVKLANESSPIEASENTTRVYSEEEYALCQDKCDKVEQELLDAKNKLDYRKSVIDTLNESVKELSRKASSDDEIMKGAAIKLAELDAKATNAEARYQSHYAWVRSEWNNIRSFWKKPPPDSLSKSK